MLANDNPINTVMKVINVPPRYSHCPRLAVNEAIEKHVNIAAVDIRAVTIICGDTVIAKSSNEPRPTPAMNNNNQVFYTTFTDL